MTDSAWQRIGDTSREPSIEEKAIVDFVLSIADDWSTGALTVAQVRRQCTPKERFVCGRFCLDAADYPAFWAMLDALIATELTDVGDSFHRTPWGVFSTNEIADVPHQYQRLADGRVRVAFVWTGGYQHE